MSYLHFSIWKPLCCIAIILPNLGFTNNPTESFYSTDFKISTCDNVTYGGLIEADEVYYPSDLAFDPAVITNVALPTGGTGDIEFLWIKSNDDPASPNAVWTPIPGSFFESYDPGIILQSTWYRRCARRSGCTEYAAESNIIAKIVMACENVTDGGTLCCDQEGCAPFSPALIENQTLPTGGNGDIEYQWYQSTVDTPFDINNPDWTIINNTNSPNYQPNILNETAYFVRASRRSDCLDYVGFTPVITITVNDTPNLMLASTNEVLCANQPEGSLHLIGDLSDISALWSDGSTGMSLENIGGDDYAVTITNAAGCTQVLQESLLAPAAIEVTFSVQDETCEGEADGSVTALVTGGIPPYTYAWNDPQNSTNAEATNLEAGPYEVTITDDNDCEVVAIVQVGGGGLIKPTVESTASTCLDGADGMAMVVAVQGGLSPYSYLWSDVNAQVTDTAFNLTPGSYQVTVTDADGCSTTESIVVPFGNPIVVGLSGSNETCNGADDGSVNVSIVNNAVAPFTYEWSNGETTSAIEDVAPGIYFITLTDANGCTGMNSFEVMQGAGLELTVFGNNETCDGSDDGDASVLSVNNGTAPYSYEWNDNNQQNTATATNLGGGTYQVMVTDVNGCTGTAGVILADGNSLIVSLSITNESCTNAADGQASVQVGGGAPPYSYTWNADPAQTNSNITGLAPDNYEVEITDANGCSTIELFTIEEGDDISYELATSDATCFGEENGTAIFNIPTANANDYSIEWGNASLSGFNQNQLSQGQYEFTITNNSGCSVSDTFTINEPNAIDLMVTTTGTSCDNSSDGSAKVSITNGDVGFTYQWNDPNNTTINEINGVPAGNYEVLITSPNGCTQIETVLIAAPNPIVIEAAATGETCSGAADGEIELVISGGVPSYIATWSDPNLSGLELGSLTAGAYQVTVTDANDCESTLNIEVGVESEFEIEVVASDISCPNENDGTAEVKVLNDDPDATFLWNDTNASTSSFITDLAPGFYEVIATSSEGCTATATAEIFEPLPLEVSVATTDNTCADDTEGTATVTVTGGVEPYTYTWNDANHQTAATATNLQVGTYTVMIVDNNGCFVEATAEIGFTSQLSADFNLTDASCNGSNDAIIEVLPNGGQAPYIVEWNGFGDGLTLENIGAGTYSGFLSDGAGCAIEITATVEEPDALTCSISLVQEISQYDGNDGSLNVSATGGTAPFSYNWSNGNTDAINENLTSGNYSVTVSDDNNCTCIADANLSNPSKIASMVWHDMNENGIRESNEPSMSNVAVTLSGTDSDGQAVNFNTTTNTAGNYDFDGLNAGVYQISVALPSNYQFTLYQMGNPDLDSDIDPTTGMTAEIQLGSGVFEENIAAGLIMMDDKINLGDRVWLDANRNGIQDANEGGVNEVVVNLWSVIDDAIIATTTTNFLGQYQFNDIQPGPYFIEFDPSSLPSTYIFTEKNVGSDTNIDSNVDTLTGRTDVFELFIFGMDDMSIDAGAFPKCDNVTNGGEIAGEEELCGIGANPGLISSVEDPSGGYGTLEYLWLQSFIPLYNGQGDPNWTPIPNSNSPTYNPGPITQTTYYIRCARRECCDDYPGESNIIAKKIKQVPLANIEAAPNVACVGEMIDFEATNAGFGSTYQWIFGENSDPQTASTRKVNDVSWTAAGVKTIQLTVAKDGCSLTVTQNISIVDCLQPTGDFDNITADVQEAAIMVNWNMTTPIADGIFYVEKSIGNTNFETIGLLHGDGRMADYEWIDPNPVPGENYYRIIWSGAGESDIESASVMAMYEAGQQVQYGVFPNPCRTQVTVDFYEMTEEVAQFQLSNTTGYVMFTETIPSGTRQWTLDVNALPSGAYYLTVIREGRRPYTQRIFKTE